MENAIEYAKELIALRKIENLATLHDEAVMDSLVIPLQDRFLYMSDSLAQRLILIAGREMFGDINA
jgi:hypothetical protein